MERRFDMSRAQHAFGQALKRLFRACLPGSSERK